MKACKEKKSKPGKHDKYMCESCCESSEKEKHLCKPQKIKKK